MDREEQIRILNRKIYHGLDAIIKIMHIKRNLKKLVELEREKPQNIPSKESLSDETDLKDSNIS